jgi:hypothetical protein
MVRRPPRFEREDTMGAQPQEDYSSEERLRHTEEKPRRAEDALKEAEDLVGENFSL